MTSFPSFPISTFVFSVFVNLARNLSIILIFTMNQTWFHFIYFLYCFFILNLMDFFSFIISFPLLKFKLIFLSYFLKIIVYVVHLTPFSFSTLALGIIDFPLSTVLASSNNFNILCFYFHLIKNIPNFSCYILFH